MADINKVYDLIGKIAVVDGTPYTIVDPTVTPESTNPVQSKGIYEFVRDELTHAVDGEAREEIANIMIEVNNLDQKIDSKMEFYKIDYAAGSLSHDGVNLTYAEIINKYNDPKYFVYVEGEGYTYIPTLPPLEGDEIIEFSSTYLYGGHAYTSRVIINSNNEIKHEEIRLLRADEAPEGGVTKAYVDTQDAALQSQIDSELAEIQQLTNNLSDTDRSLDMLWKLNKGQTYDFFDEVQTGIATHPSGEFSKSVIDIRGNSIQDGEPSPTNPVDIVSVEQINISVDGTVRIIIPPFPLNKIDDYYDYADLKDGTWNRVSRYFDLSNGITSVSYESSYKRLLLRSSILNGLGAFSRKGYCNVGNLIITSVSREYEPYKLVVRDGIMYCWFGKEFSLDDINNMGIKIIAFNPDEIIKYRINQSDLEYLKSLHNLDKSVNITITDQNGNDISYLLEYIIKLNEVN